MAGQEFWAHDGEVKWNVIQKKFNRSNESRIMKHNHNHDNAHGPGTQLVNVRFEFTHGRRWPCW
jgi:hypothetical protein